MDAFILNGYDGDKIHLTIEDIIGFPKQTDINGGYAFKGEVEICSYGYTAKGSVYSSTGVLYKFANQLEECFKNLTGTAEYSVLYEENLIFKVRMKTGGKAVIEGEYREYSDKKNILKFEFETDQSCFMRVIESINLLKETYGDMQVV